MGRAAEPGPQGGRVHAVGTGGGDGVEDFAQEVADAEGGEPLPAHETTKIIGEWLIEAYWASPE